jgi:hypothetical protein
MRRSSSYDTAPAHLQTDEAREVEREAQLAARAEWARRTARLAADSAQADFKPEGAAAEVRYANTACNLARTSRDGITSAIPVLLQMRQWRYATPHVATEPTRERRAADMYDVEIAS